MHFKCKFTKTCFMCDTHSIQFHFPLFSCHCVHKMYDQEDEIIISLCIIIIASVLQRIQRKKRPRKKWVHAWIQRCRKHALVKELSDEDPQGFRNFLRLDTRDFFLNNAETECSKNVLLLYLAGQMMAV